MPSDRRRRFFNHHDFLLSDKKISGSDNLDDAIETVGRKYCRTGGHGGKGVLIYGNTTDCPITSKDYHTVHKGRPLEDSKRLYIIINSLQFHLCFCILHIEATTWRIFVEDFLNLGNKHTNAFTQIGDRRRSPKILDFVEHCVTKLTQENQNKLFLLNDALEDDDKIRLVYLVLKHGWDFVLNEICVGDPNCFETLPLFNMTKEQFKTEYVVDVNVIIQRSTTMYGQYLDELKQNRKKFERDAKGVGEMICMVANKENSNDNNGDDNNKDDGDLSISSSTNNKTGKRKHEENNNGDDDGVDNNNSNTNNNDTATRSYMENPSERSSSLRDEEKQQKKKKKKKKKKTKKKKKKSSNDDSDDDATIVSPTKKMKRSNNENGFVDDDSNNNNNKSFRPEKDNIESNEEDEILDADFSDFAFCDDFSMDDAINSITNNSYNINGAMAAAASYKVGVEDFVTDVTGQKEDASNGRSANQAAAENKNNISTTDTINQFRSLPFPREEVDDSDNAMNHEGNGANDLISPESVSHDGGNHDDDSVAQLFRERIIVASGAVSDTDTNTKTNTDSNASTNTNRDRNTHNDTNNDVLYNDKNYSTNAPSFQRPGQSDRGDDSNKEDMILDDGKTSNFADDISKDGMGSSKDNNSVTRPVDSHSSELFKELLLRNNSSNDCLADADENNSNSNNINAAAEEAAAKAATVESAVATKGTPKIRPKKIATTTVPTAESAAMIKEVGTEAAASSSSSTAVVTATGLLDASKQLTAPTIGHKAEEGLVEENPPAAAAPKAATAELAPTAETPKDTAKNPLAAPAPTVESSTKGLLATTKELSTPMNQASKGRATGTEVTATTKIPTSPMTSGRLKMNQAPIENMLPEDEVNNSTSGNVDDESRNIRSEGASLRDGEKAVDVSDNLKNDSEQMAEKCLLKTRQDVTNLQQQQQQHSGRTAPVATGIVFWRVFLCAVAIVILSALVYVYLPQLIAIRDGAVATPPVVVVTDATEYPTDSTAAFQDQAHIGDPLSEETDISLTLGCAFVAAVTTNKFECIICNSTCWECGDNTEINIEKEKEDDDETHIGYPIREETDISPTLGCAFVAAVTTNNLECIICNSTCWECVDNIDINIEKEKEVDDEKFIVVVEMEAPVDAVNTLLPCYSAAHYSYINRAAAAAGILLLLLLFILWSTFRLLFPKKRKHRGKAPLKQDLVVVDNKATRTDEHNNEVAGGTVNGVYIVADTGTTEDTKKDDTRDNDAIFLSKSMADREDSKSVENDDVPREVEQTPAIDQPQSFDIGDTTMINVPKKHEFPLATGDPTPVLSGEPTPAATGLIILESPIARHQAKSPPFTKPSPTQDHIHSDSGTMITHVPKEDEPTAVTGQFKPLDMIRMFAKETIERNKDAINMSEERSAMWECHRSVNKQIANLSKTCEKQQRAISRLEQRSPTAIDRSTATGSNSASTTDTSAPATTTTTTTTTHLDDLDLAMALQVSMEEEGARRQTASDGLLVHSLVATDAARAVDLEEAVTAEVAAETGSTELPDDNEAVAAASGVASGGGRNSTSNSKHKIKTTAPQLPYTPLKENNTSDRKRKRNTALGGNNEATAAASGVGMVADEVATKRILVQKKCSKASGGGRNSTSNGKHKNKFTACKLFSSLKKEKQETQNSPVVSIGRDRLDNDTDKENNTSIWKRNRDKIANSANSISKRLKFTKP